ncbi:MAG: Gfo/Idh/MocA family oxidoreductase [Bacteroidota bacterium]
MKLVCIGAGYFARFHLDAWNRIPDTRVVALCDREEQKARLLAREFGVAAVYQDFREMIEKSQPDLIDLITPPQTRLELVRQLVPFGIPLIIQKPVAPTLDEVEAMLELSDRYKVRVLVHENFRFQPWYRQIRKLLDQGELGEDLHSLYFRMRMGDGWQEDAYLSRQPYFRDMPRLLIYETGVHFIDVFRYLGGEIQKVYARLNQLNSQIKGEDSGIICFDFLRGGQGVLDASRYHEVDHPNPRYTFGVLRLEGDKGNVTMDLSGKIFLKRLGAPSREIAYPHQDKGFAGDCVHAFQLHAKQSILSGQEAETELSSYFPNLIVQEAIYRSSNSGNPIQTYPPERA